MFPQGTKDITCPLCKVEPEDNFHLMLSCNIVKHEWDMSGEKLLSIAEVHCRQKCDVLANVLRNLDDYSRILLLSGGLKLPFQKHTSDTVRRFISVSVHKLYKIRNRLVTKGTIKHGGSSACFSPLARWLVYDNMSIHRIFNIVFFPSFLTFFPSFILGGVQNDGGGMVLRVILVGWEA